MSISKYSLDELLDVHVKIDPDRQVIVEREFYCTVNMFRIIKIISFYYDV